MLDSVNLSYVWKWWRSVDKYLFFSFLLLIFCGVFFIFSATPVIAKKLHLNRFYFVWKHFIYMIPSMVAMVGISMLSMKQMRRTCVIIFAVTVLLMLLVPIFGTEIKGAKRWINLFFFALQPSELMKFTFVIFSAWMLSEHSEKFPGYQVATVCVGFVIMLLLLQPDLGMALLVFSTWIAQFFVATLSIYFILLLALCGALSMVGFYYIFPHVAARIDKFFGIGENYQIQKSLESLSHGGFWGLGPGEGMVKSQLPDAHSDFIFSVIAEEFGIVVCLFIILVFGFIVVRSLILALNLENQFQKLSIVGLSYMFGTQVIINVSSAINLIPTKGMTLPFISYGGSSSFAIGMCAGILLGLTKSTVNYHKYY